MTHKQSSRPRGRRPDADVHKGAVESQAPQQEGNSSLQGQLGHRTRNEMIKSSDSDFPEPGGNPEHSGEPEEKNSEGATQDQDPGHRQKRNQGDQREDPLAS